MSTKSAVSWPCSCSSVAVPLAVCRVSARAASRGRPHASPASMNACSTRAMNAGPDPDTAVTAFRCSSSTSSATPSARSRSPTTRASCSVADGPRAKPAAISPTTHGRLGITRTRRAPGSQPARRARVTPAAIDTTSRPPRSTPEPASAADAACRCCGLTARNRISASRATAPLSAAGAAPVSAQNRFSTSRTGSYAVIAPARPAAWMPRASPDAMVPAPTKPREGREVLMVASIRASDATSPDADRS